MSTLPSWRLVDFDLDNAALLGCGAISLLQRCQHRLTGHFYAIKVMSKVQLLQQKRQQVAFAEKQALLALQDRPSFPYLFGTMQSEDELYFIIELLPGGDLLEHIRRVAGLRRQKNLGRCSSTSTSSSAAATRPCLSLKDTQLITAQILVALRHVFRKGYTLRDLKPENICFRGGRVVLIDFDTAIADSEQPLSLTDEDAIKQVVYRRTSEIAMARRQSSLFCGTAQYVSPEAMMECLWSFSSDLFALGSVVYHMLTGEPLFNGPSSFLVMQEIKKGVQAKVFPTSVTRHTGAAAFITGLLHPDPTKRLGVVRRVDDEVANKAQPYYEFDLDVFKSTDFFRDFSADQWAAVEAVDEEEYRRTANATDSHTFTNPSPIEYDDTPCHSDEYAKYVHEVGDGPLERAVEASAEKINVNTDLIPSMLGCAGRDEGHGSCQKRSADCATNAEDADEKYFQQEEEAPALEPTARSDDDSDDGVEDDLGIVAAPNAAHGETNPTCFSADSAWVQDTTA